MKQAVADAFPSFSAKFEGRVSWMYLDVLGLVTTGVGNLIDPIGAAMNLPWCHEGNPADPADDASIVVGWNAVKSMPKAMVAAAYSGACDLRLTDQAIDALVRSRAAEMDHVLAIRFPQWPTWPADAQLAILSLAWACGPAFRFPKLEEMLLVGDFGGAASEVEIDPTGNPGVIPRNAANRALLLAATLPGLDGNMVHVRGSSGTIPAVKPQ